MSRSRHFASWMRLLAAFVVACWIAGPSEARATTHKVHKGQTLGKIAKRYNVSVADITQANGITRNKPIRPGQILEIPDGKEGGPKKKDKKAEKKADKKEEKQADKKEDTKKGKNAWVSEPPPQNTQTQKTVEARGGVNPCLTKDPGYGVYDRWNKSGLPMGQALIPGRGGVTKSGRFDVMFHFHGHDPARKEWVRAMNGTVFVGVTLGIGSGVYSSTFSNPNAFKQMVASVEKMVAEKTGKKKASVRKVGLSAWSAGYGAVEQIISQQYGKKMVDTVILLDGLHSSYGAKTNADTYLDSQQLQPFIDFAKKAKAGQKFMFVSHSSIIPPGYASTYETASYLVYKLGGKPRNAKPRRSDPMGLELIRRWDSGNFHLRGYRGNDKMDHCAHIGLFEDVVRVHIKPRWNSPTGFKANKK